MKKSWEISARSVAFGLIGWLIATNLLVWTAHSTGWWPLKLVLFLCLSFLPGIALLRALHIRLGNVAAKVVYSFGLSMLMLMLSGLTANQVLPSLGIARPLELAGALGTWSVMTLIIIVASAFTNGRSVQLRLSLLRHFSKPAWLAIGLSLVLPFIAIAGAFRLNNGGDALVAGLALCFAAALIIYSFLLRHHLPDGVLAWLVFVIGLTILLMTSLRGWDIVGHDIAREFRVYTLAHTHAHWDIGLDRDPYNACLSITILPEMFARILDVSGLMVFKVLLQVVFAACPAVLYVLLRQYVSQLGALVGSMLFICYPTFINDSAMLTRQGVAYLFFALALVVITNKARAKRYKVLFLLCALGAILSHYSTAYMFVALFAIAVICKFGITWWQKRQGKVVVDHWRHTVLSPLFAGLIFFMTFMWYSQITATSSGLATTLHKSLVSIPELFTDENRSSDTSIALLFANAKTQADLYNTYLAQSQRAGADLAPAYTPVLTSDDVPLTKLGEQASAMGIDSSVITTLRQNFAKVLQVLAIAGVGYMTFALLRRKAAGPYVKSLGIDFISLSLASIMLLGLMVILPVLSVNYGVLRAFQQALIFLLLPITFLLIILSGRLWPWLRTTLATTGTVVLFLLFTGLFAQLLGGTSPSLSMNNRGLYYGLYYSPAADLRSLVWLKEQLPEHSDVRTANSNKARMYDPIYPFTKPGILPSQIGPESYVYLDQAQVLTQKFYTYHESSPLILTFPLEYYDLTKDRIYSTTSTRVYR